MTTTPEQHTDPSDNGQDVRHILGAVVGLTVLLGILLLAFALPAVSAHRLIAVGLFAVVGGFTLTAILEYVIGTLDGNYLLTSLGAMLGIAATAMAVIGLKELLGNPGLAVAGVLLILLGNPLSGLASAPEMLPTPWGTIGQLLPPGATGSLIRGLAFFDGAGTAHAIIVLACWLAAGTVLFVLAERRKSIRARRSVPAVEPATP